MVGGCTMRRKTCLAVCIAGLLLLTVRGVPAGSPSNRWQKRWVYMAHNLYVNENLPKIEDVLRRASRAGYNGLLFCDYKMFTWWQLDSADRWKRNAQRLRRLTKELGLELVIGVFPFGYSGSMLWHNVNLATGMPIKDAPLVAKNGGLVPVQTAEIRNGSFEEYRGHTALRYSFQDNPGQGSFIDREIRKHGRASLRFEDVGKVNRHGHGRISQQVSVSPWQHYRIRAWMKTEKLTAGEMKILVLGGGRVLQWQFLGVPVGKGFRYVSRPRDFTTDWVEQSVTFNSLDNSSVRVYLGIWGGKTGKIWWDDCRIDSVPTLNLLRRDSLPLKIEGKDGTLYEEGKDFERVADPRLGRQKWPGSYDTRHEPPAIRLTGQSRIKEGQEVKFSGYHATIVYKGQMSASLFEPQVFELCKLQIQKTEEALSPDGYFMSHDEIRCAGWEPGATQQLKTSGELFAYNIRRCYEIAHEGGGGKPVYVWSDMYDPHHNAHADYYLVNNTVEGSWEGLSPKVIVMKWGGGKIARPGLEFFAKRGHQQMIAGYYDGDVAANHKMWTDAARGVSGVVGAMYTTWGSNYRDLEKFAEIWWGGGR